MASSWLDAVLRAFSGDSRREEEILGSQLALLCKKENRLAATVPSTYQVFKVELNGAFFAVKKVLYSGDVIEREWIHPLELDHENVVKVHAVGRTEDFMFVVMDLCAASLDRLYDKEEIYDGPKPADKLKALLEIAKGVAYIHKENKIHRDIKPQNILISFDGRLVVADFGCAKATNLSGSCSCSGGFGTRAYLSPEILERTPSDVIKVRINNKTDVFSTGLVFFYYLTEGFHPFGDATGPIYELESNICNGKAVNFDKLANSDLKELIRETIDYNREKRPTMEEVENRLEELFKNRHLAAYNIRLTE